MTWGEFEPVLRERLTRVIEAQPELLLEHDGGPEGLRADIILATLYGFDEQVDAEWHIPDVRTPLLRPLPQRPTMAVNVGPESLDLPVARYDLQSNWAEMTLDYLAHRDLLPSDVYPSPGTNQVKVALLRYRRRA